MEMRTQSIDGQEIIHLSGEFTISSAMEDKQLLMEILATHDEIILDLEKITDFDSAGFQLLLSLEKSSSQLGKQFSICKLSDAANNVFSIYGIKQIIPAI